MPEPVIAGVRKVYPQFEGAIKTEKAVRGTLSLIDKTTILDSESGAFVNWKFRMAALEMSIDEPWISVGCIRSDLRAEPAEYLQVRNVHSELQSNSIIR